MDSFANFVKLTVDGGVSAADTTISLLAGSDILPAPPFNLVLYCSDYPDVISDPDKEIIRVTAVDTTNDNLTVIRGQEGTIATDHNVSGKTYYVIQAITNKTIDDINTHIINTSNPHNVTASQVGAITRVEDDTAPKLGGELNAQNHSIGFTMQSFTGGTITIDWRNGNKAKVTLTADTTLTFTAPSNPCNLVLMLVQDATGGHSITLPTIKWSNGVFPILSTDANSIDIITLFFDGTDYYGFIGRNFQ